jgi:hypothetical protein
VDDFYLYEGHKLWWWLFQLNLALIKDTPDRDEHIEEALELVQDILEKDLKIWPDKLYTGRSVLW